ncbi:MAG: heme ABC exporter ATP-binding protein CcmA [Rhodoblastus sp.]|nr:heme ABC exporter ATP-binding protein CcmA [Rhodoblastus sp.]
MRLLAEKVCVDRGGRRIVEGVDFVLSDGEALILSGPNGAGKSTLLRAIAGLLPLAAGALTLDGESEEIAAALHYVGHAEGMKPALTVRQNLDFWSSFLSREGAAAALAPQDALAAFGLAHVIDIPAGYLSAGQKRRVALARLLVAPRPVWLLDEPTTALDVRAQAALAAVMARHRAGGGVVLAATHSPVGLENAAELKLGTVA